MTPRWDRALWATTTELCHEYGLPEKAIRQRVHDGDLIPTYRGPGLGRWTREDFAAQIAGATGATSRHLPGDVQLWSGAGWQVIAQPGHSVALEVTGETAARLLLDPEWAMGLASSLLAAITVADVHHPGCTCRELSRAGHVEMVVPVPSCPIHKGATP